MNTYLLFKSIHLIAVISWMAGLLYLPRIFVYHVDRTNNKEISETFKIMERRLMIYIMNPAMIVTILSGGILILSLGEEAWIARWFYLKLLFVFCLIVIHMAMAKWRKMFAIDQNQHSKNFFRIINEVPTALMILIVLLVVIQPN